MRAWSSSVSDRARTLSMSIVRLRHVVADDDPRRDRQLVAGEAHRLDGLGPADAGHLEEDPARLDDRDPVVGGALAGAHPGLGRLLRGGLVGEDPDPDLAAALDRAGHRAPGGLDLTARDPGRLLRGQAVLTECHGMAAFGHPGHASAHDLAVLD